MGGSGETQQSLNGDVFEREGCGVEKAADEGEDVRRVERGQGDNSTVLLAKVAGGECGEWTANEQKARVVDRLFRRRGRKAEVQERVGRVDGAVVRTEEVEVGARGAQSECVGLPGREGGARHLSEAERWWRGGGGLVGLVRWRVMGGDFRI